MTIDITFYRHFGPDILEGRKTITLRDQYESHFHAGQQLKAGYQDNQGYFATLEVIGVTPVLWSQLTEEHAQQENMTLAESKQVISGIYPGTEQLYMIRFRCLPE